MLSSFSDIKAADELPPPSIRQQDKTAQTLESFLVYLAEFEDEQGEWMDPMLLDLDDENGGMRNE